MYNHGTYNIKGEMMAIPVSLLITILVYALLGLSFALIRGCEKDISALRRQSEEIRLWTTRLRADVAH